MCGFFGSFGADVERTKNMESLSHRGPNEQNSYQSRSVYFKHFRLAIIGSQAEARQPMTSLDGRVILVFNGEVYNYKELAYSMGRPELEKDGDTRVLVEFLAKYKLERLELLNGMFSFAVYFKDSNSLYIARDRFGIKPLYYLLQNGGIYFASEIKSLLSLKQCRLNRKQVINYLDFGTYPTGEETMYEGIKQLDAGSWIKSTRESFVKQKWYNFCRQSCNFT